MDPVVAFYSGGPDNRGGTLNQILAWPDTQLESVHDYIQWVFPTIQPSGVNPYAPLVTRDTIRAFEERSDLRERLRAALDRTLAFYGLRWDACAATPAPATDALRGRDGQGPGAPSAHAGPGRQGPKQSVEEPQEVRPPTRNWGRAEFPPRQAGNSARPHFRSQGRTLRSAPARLVLDRTLRIVFDTARFPERARNWLRPFNHNHLRLTRIMDSLSTLGLRDEARALQRCLVEDIYHGPGKGKISEETRDHWRDAVRPR